ncbi:MAG: hypothetical protein ACOY7L_14005 [Pseudomonadota bacterium]
MAANNLLPRLELPRRWELLQQRAGEAEVDPSVVVERVDDAAEHLDGLLRRVRTGGGGLIEVLFWTFRVGKNNIFENPPKIF